MIKGALYSEGSSVQSSAELIVASENYSITTEDGRAFYGKSSDLHISDRIGNIERKLTLPDGAVFATKDNDAVDRLFKGQNKLSHFISTIESKTGWVLVALVIAIITPVIFFKWGLPWASEKIAHSLPHETNEFIAKHSLDFLDDYFFEPSELGEDTKQRIRNDFNDRLIPLDDANSGIDYELHFRNWVHNDQSIPNAFALPSGDIILTDKFVELSKNQDEIASVLLHEIGHVRERHSLESIIRATIITSLAIVITGDGSALIDIGVGMGSLLISSSYSRNHESEADEYAFNRMLEAKIDPLSFSSILEEMTLYMNNLDTETPEAEAEAEAEKQDSILDYISSHPATGERVENAKRYSACFKQGLLTCESSE